MSSRQATAIIDLDAIRHNFDQAKQRAPASKVMAVVKADAYGHGASKVAQALVGADAFGVARVSEAVKLRESGIGQPICLLEGVNDPEELNLASVYELQVVLHNWEQLELLATRGARRHAWVKVDTGMGRLGFSVEETPSVLQKLGHQGLLGLMTHLADAGDKKSTTTGHQIARITSLANSLDVPGSEVLSIANSGGVLALHNPPGDWVRPGLMLYGASPFDDLDPIPSLHAAMSFGAPVIAVRTIRQGESVGYGGVWTADKDSTIAVIAVGYADGYPREIAQGAPVLVNGVRYPLVGRVSMDMICVQLDMAHSVKVGDRAILWGDDLPVEEIADKAGTIPYTLLCGVTARVNRRHRGNSRG
ncbi:MAG: alanine racemase [Pseudomonadales bacterium]